jgi:hypothetical protein
MIWQFVMGMGWMLVGIGVGIMVMECRRAGWKERMSALDLTVEARDCLDDIEAETDGETRALNDARCALSGLMAEIALGG